MPSSDVFFLFMLTEVECPSIKPLLFGTVRQESFVESQPKTFYFECNEGFELYPKEFNKIRCVQNLGSVGEWRSETNKQLKETDPVCFGKTSLHCQEQAVNLERWLSQGR